MGKVHERIDDPLRDFLLRQRVFFVGTAPLDRDGHMNISPKGICGTFMVLGPMEVAYLDLTGSGIETIAHIRENGRIVLMFCAFEEPPRIVRLYGRGEVVSDDDVRFAEYLRHFSSIPGSRSVIRIDLERVADSCGYGVPVMSYVADRDQLSSMANRKGPDGLREYRNEKNALSIDGLPGLPSPGLLE